MEGGLESWVLGRALVQPFDCDSGLTWEGGQRLDHLEHWIIIGSLLEGMVRHRPGCVGPPILDRIGLDWIGLDWIGLEWSGLDWSGLDWIGFVKSAGHWHAPFGPRWRMLPYRRWIRSALLSTLLSSVLFVVAMSEECDSRVFYSALGPSGVQDWGTWIKGERDRIQGFNLIGSLVTNPFPASGRADPVVARRSQSPRSVTLQPILSRRLHPSTNLPSEQISSDQAGTSNPLLLCVLSSPRASWRCAPTTRRQVWDGWRRNHFPIPSLPSLLDNVAI